jgi:pimeloyl-ACP methyl ester carboxylesterase
VNQQLPAVLFAKNSIQEKLHISTITVKDDTTIYYKDWGNGPVVTFSHGWPLSSDAWDNAGAGAILPLEAATLGRLPRYSL